MPLGEHKKETRVILPHMCSIYQQEAHSSVISWGTMLQAGKSRARFPMSLDFLIYLRVDLPQHYGPGVDSGSNRNEYQEYSWAAGE
jgi:hypothetical protein